MATKIKQFYNPTKDTNVLTNETVTAFAIQAPENTVVTIDETNIIIGPTGFFEVDGGYSPKILKINVDGTIYNPVIIDILYD